MRAIEHAAAISIFLLHSVVVFIAVFGWLFPSMWPLYMALLVIILLQNIVLKYCILSRWEFSLRRMLDRRIRYDYTFSSYYTYKLTHKRLSTEFIRTVSLVFLVVSIAVNLYFH